MLALVVNTAAWGQNLKIIDAYQGGNNYKDVSTFGVWPSWRPDGESTAIRTNAFVKTTDARHYHLGWWEWGQDHNLHVGEGRIFSEPNQFVITNYYEVEVYGSMTPVTGGVTNVLDPYDSAFWYAVGQEVAVNGRSKETHDYSVTVEAVNPNEEFPALVILDFINQGGGDLTYKDYKLSPGETRRISPSLDELQKAAKKQGNGAHRDKIFVLIFWDIQGTPP